MAYGNRSKIMGKRRVWYYRSEYGTVFWNSEGFIHYIHENDMEYREEFFQKIIDYLDVIIKYYEGEELPEWVEDYIRKMES